MDAWFFERQARIALRCNENDFGGIIRASSMKKEGGLYNPILITLAHYFREGNQEIRKRIERLIKDAEFFKDKKITDDPDLAKYIFEEIRDLRINAFNDNDYKL